MEKYTKNLTKEEIIKLKEELILIQANRTKDNAKREEEIIRIIINGKYD